MRTKRRRTGNSSFQWYKIIVDENGKKHRVQRQPNVLGDMPTLGSAMEAFKADYGKKAHRELRVKTSKWYGKKVPAKAAR